MTVIENHEGLGRFSRDYVQWCVTVPSFWDENAMLRMKARMVNSGLVSAEGGLESVNIVLELEPALFQCHEFLRLDYHRDVPLHLKDKIMIADVGGRAVEIMVQEVVESGKIFKVQDLTERSGGLSGGTFVDESFMRFLSRRIECLDEFLLLDMPSYKSHLLKVWEEIKRDFGREIMSNTYTRDISLHSMLGAKWEAHERERGCNSWRESCYTIKIVQKDLESIVDPAVDEILGLISAQLIQVEGIKVMFVVCWLSLSHGKNSRPFCS